MYKFLIISNFILILFIQKTYAQSDTILTFSEIMFAPLSGQSEFVEIYNTSESDTINLAGFQLKYLHTSNTDNIIAHNNGTKLNPNSFAVIFEEDYDFDIGIYNSLIPPEVLVIKIDNGSFASGLSNSSDRTLLLINSSGVIIDTYTYSANNSNGISDEKIILNKINTSGNWSNSLTENGTPGNVNSVSPLNFDLAVSYIFFDPEIQFTGLSSNLNVTVKNLGTKNADMFSVNIYNDKDNDSTVTNNDKIYSQFFTNMQSGDSINLGVDIILSEERAYLFIIEIIFEPDENLLNNISYAEFLPLPKPVQFNDLIINEIMYKPPGDEPEWIEIYNASIDSINIIDWSISDRTSKVKIASKPVFIYSGEYLILSEDESIFDFYDIPSQTIILKLPSLNNSGDDLYIKDQYGSIIDSVLYLSAWGGSSGTSLERVNIVEQSSAAYNWSSAITLKNGTPGEINSVTPKDYDLEIESFSASGKFIINPFPAVLSAAVYNKGNRSVNNAELRFYNDLNHDSLNSENELIYSEAVVQIEPGETKLYSFEYYNYNIGINTIIAEINFEDDQFVENNSAGIKFTSVIINEVRNDIVINEFMPAPNSEGTEWIEIFNRSNKIIDLLNYQLADESDTAKIINNSISLNPTEYFVIIDDSSFFEKYDIKSKYAVANFPSLNNTADNIILLDSLNRVIDSLNYNPEWEINTGISLERIDPFGNSEETTNWKNSNDINSATPGFINSVTQKSFDVSISQIIFSPDQPLYGDDILIGAIIKNKGKEISEFNVSLYVEDLFLESSPSIMLSSGDSILYTFNYIIENIKSEKIITVEINYEHDQDTSNNILSANISPGYSYNSLVINEVMFTPQNGEPEWVEMYNNKDYKINLNSFSISDIFTTPVRTAIEDSAFYIEPGSYIVISKDSAINNFHEEIPSKILIAPFANLNNSEDGVVIKDIYNNLIDSLHYTSNWHTRTGYSIERASFSSPTNDSSKWNYSTDIEQSTPGRINSVSQKSYDLEVSGIIHSPLIPKYGEEIILTALIKNVGYLEAQNIHVKFYDENNTIIEDIFIPEIYFNDSSNISTNGFRLFNTNKYFVQIDFPLDNNYTNDKDSITVIPSFTQSDILINEVMFNPKSGEPEWVEFVNESNHEINLYKWKISDNLPSPKDDFLTERSLNLYPDQYFIVTNDSSGFHKLYNTEVPVFQSAFGTLGNTEDGIFIYDYYDEIIDSLFYNSEFGSVKGSSIERVSLDSPTNDITNWLVSINSNGSTPGFANSIIESKSYDRNHVVINEIMYEPGFDNSEFVEFYNNSNETIEMGGWMLENDSGDIYRIANGNLLLYPDSYFVFAADSLFYSFYNYNEDTPFINLQNKSGLGLKNDEQILLLRDINSNLIDSVHYISTWHNPNIFETKNKSLERLNPNFDSNEPSNWSTSANSIGATPGKVNSIFTDNKFNSSGLTISPNPFSPDNDGFEDFCQINYTLGIPLSQIRIKIFDDRGRLVRSLANNQPSGSTGSIIFNGLNDNNLPLRIGMYIVYFEATNAKTGAQEILKDVIVIARKL